MYREYLMTLISSSQLHKWKKKFPNFNLFLVYFPAFIFLQPYRTEIVNFSLRKWFRYVTNMACWSRNIKRKKEKLQFLILLNIEIKILDV